MENEGQEGSANKSCKKDNGTVEATNKASDGDSTMPTSIEKKHQMTLSTSPMSGFFFQGVPASPPKFVSLDQIMKAANGVSDMFLAHEIAVNGDFVLDKVEPEDSIHKKVKEVVHKAFWDILRAELNESPPNFTQAMILLCEVKEGLLSILLPYHSRLKTQINEILDIDLIQQQAENETLDFMYYARYIISTMSQLCAPVRDAKIAEVELLEDIIEIYRGILETLDLMKLDMANFTIQQFRPHIQQHSVEYERRKFQEFLDLQTTLSHSGDGLEFTRQWLKQVYEKTLTMYKSGAPHYVVLTKAYVQLFEWDDDTVFPETLLLDQARFLAQRDELTLITLTASILLITYSAVGEKIQEISGFKERLKDHVWILVEDANKRRNEFQMKIENIGMQVVKEVNECLKAHGHNTLTQEKEKLLLGQIGEVSSPENSVRSLVKDRIMTFLEKTLKTQLSPNDPVKIPPGLSSFQKELSHMAGQFLRLVGHNRSVFGEFYADIITVVAEQMENNGQESEETTTTEDARLSV